MEAHARASALNSDATLHIIAMKISRIEKLFASAIFSRVQRQYSIFSHVGKTGGITEGIGL